MSCVNRDSSARELKRLIGKAIAGPFFIWLGLVTFWAAFTLGFSLDDHDYTVQNRSSVDIIVTPVSPPDEAGRHHVVARRQLKERRFPIHAGAAEVINLETGDFRILGWVVQAEGGAARFLQSTRTDVIIPPLEKLPLATSGQIEPHVAQLGPILRSAGLLLGPPILVSCLYFASLYSRHRRRRSQ